MPETESAPVAPVAQAPLPAYLADLNEVQRIAAEAVDLVQIGEIGRQRSLGDGRDGRRFGFGHGVFIACRVPEIPLPRLISRIQLLTISAGNGRSPSQPTPRSANGTNATRSSSSAAAPPMTTIWWRLSRWRCVC